MMDFFGFFGSIFGYLLWGAYYLVKNFGIAIIIFTVVVKVIMFPLTIKQQKSAAGNARMQAKQKELREKYGNNKAKYNEEVSKLYEKEGVSPTSGCLSSFVPLILMLGVFYAVAYPLTNTMHIAAEQVNSTLSYIQTVPGHTISSNTTYQQIEVIKIFENISSTDFVKNTFSPEQIQNVVDFSKSFNFFGLDLLATPKEHGFSMLLLIPILCFITSVGSQFFMMKFKGSPMADQQGCMKVTMLLLPLISVYFSYVVPAAVGFYWICSTVIGFLQSMITNKYYNPTVLTAKSEAQRVTLLFDEEANVKKEEA